MRGVKFFLALPFFAAVALACLCSGCSDKSAIKETIKREKARISTELGHIREPVPIPVRVISVALTNSSESVSYVGSAEASKSAVVLSGCSGIIEEMVAVQGRKVRKGDVVARMRSERLLSAYEAAKATLIQAEDALERVEKVYESGSVSDMKMMEVKTRVEQARASEKAARSALDDCTVRAPFSGVIDELYAHTGETVPLASPLVRILDSENIEIHFNVPENEYLSIDIGDRAVVEVPALGCNFDGVVTVKGSGASRLSHSYDFVLKCIGNPRGLVAGMVCKVRMKSNSAESIVIPATALMTDMEGRYVWGVCKDSTVCKNYVAVGGFSGSGVIISEGLGVGDMVIVEGSRKVSTGMKVKVLE